MPTERIGPTSFHTVVDSALACSHLARSRLRTSLFGSVWLFKYFLFPIHSILFICQRYGSHPCRLESQLAAVCQKKVVTAPFMIDECSRALASLSWNDCLLTFFLVYSLL